MKKKYLIILILVILMSLGASFVAIAGFIWYTQPVDKSNQSIQTFVVPKGQAISVIGTRLHQEKIIAHPLLFRVAVQLNNVSEKIQAGTFELSPAMTPSEIALSLTQGTQDVWVTVIEGWRMEQIASSLSQLGLQHFDENEFKKLVVDTQTEGQLFPDTYLIPKQYTTVQIHNLLTETFQKKVLTDLEAEFQASSYDPREILIMASLVEREAREYQEMRGVAGVLWKRISIGMPLQVDATMQYAKGYNQSTQSWWSPPSASDKALESPFNTYLINGLPPKPISNPSLNAIKATLNPEVSNNLFYIHDDSGIIRFAETLQGHNENVNTYLR
jgi:UPF0755 protein